MTRDPKSHIRHFRPGSAVYTCEVCKKRTRDTKGDVADPTMCARCDELAMAANSISDRRLNRVDARAHAEEMALTQKGGPLTDEEWARMQWAINE